MSEHGIIMTCESVRAIQAGTKTQTRRVFRVGNSEYDSGLLSRYVPGNLLWVKEAHGVCVMCRTVSYRASDRRCEHDGIGRWRSPRFMPRELSRITIRVTDVRIERLQEISDADCFAEGIQQAVNEGIIAQARPRRDRRAAWRIRRWGGP